MSGDLQRPLNCGLLPSDDECHSASARTRSLPEVIHL